jgi:hypothetical protein
MAAGAHVGSPKQLPIVGIRRTLRPDETLIFNVAWAHAFMMKGCSSSG